MIYPRVALLVIGDGRADLNAATLVSWHSNAREYDLTRLVTVDDSHHVLGFCGAIRFGWRRLREPGPPFDYVCHLEEDWRFERPFSIAHMTRVLDTEPQVCQVALRRGVAPGEQAAVVDQYPHEFEDRHTGLLGFGKPARVQAWLEHRLFWTTNPSVYRASLVEQFEWPEPPRCEASFGESMIAEGCSFAYWGARDDEPWITHTGMVRTGHGY